jgi:hypothetical protein
MRTVTMLGLASTLALAACFGNKAIKIDETEAEAAAARWNGTLTTPSAMRGVVQVRGSAWLARDGGRMRAFVSIENATKGGVHPWHVHRGRCGYDNGVVGSASKYPALEVNGDGKASERATIDESFPVQGDYFVNVHASADNLQTIIACANLAPPTQP